MRTNGEIVRMQRAEAPSSFLRFLHRDHPHPPPLCGFGDECRQPTLSRLLLFRARHPMRDETLVSRRLIAEIPPRFFVCSKFLFVRRRQLGGRSFIRIDTRFFLAAFFELPRSGGRHQTALRQLRCPTNIDCAPDASPPPRRKADAVADIVNPPADSVDPAK